MFKIMVTGVNGFVGKHLVRELSGRGVDVIGLSTQPNAHPEVTKLLDRYEVCDLTVESAVARLNLDDVNCIINLAGLAKVGDSFGKGELYNKVNVGVLDVIGRRILREKKPIRVIAIGSAVVYSNQAEMPLTESSPIDATSSPYAKSKWLMERAAETLRTGGLDCVIVRPFNHIGPGQEEGFLVPDMIRRISQSLAQGKPLMTGNLKTRRDYTDVRDIVRAYAGLATATDLSHNLYNVCSGRSVNGQEIVNQLIKLLGAEGKLEIRVDKSLLRPNDVAEIIGSYDRLKQDIGWQPKIKLDQTLADAVAYLD